MRVALVTPRYAPAIGGVERVAEMEARELVRRGVHVEVVTTDPTGTLPAVEHRDGVLVRRFPTLARDAVYLVAPGVGRWLNGHAHTFDVVHAHSYHAPLALQAALAARAADRPFVVTPHYHGTGHTPFRRLLHTPYRPLGRWLLRRAVAVPCVSRVEEVLLRERFGSLRTAIVPNGIDADELSTARRRQTNRKTQGINVLVVGRLDAYKCSPCLIDAVPHLPAASRVSLIGDGPLRGALASAAHAQGVGSQVQFRGWLSRAELLDAYAAADVFVSVSRHESFGLAALEAGAAGLPVLLSDIPAHREIAGYLPADRAQFVDAGADGSTLALGVRAASSRGRTADIGGWPLPTWAQHVDALVRTYTSHVSARGAA